MTKNKSNQKSLKRKKIPISKTKLEWLILIILILFIPIGIWTNLFAYGYNYIRCEGKPIELDGMYYRSPYDEGYAIRNGSNYNFCLFENPPNAQRDPSTKIGADIALKNDLANIKQSSMHAKHVIYTPSGYKIQNIDTRQNGNELMTRYEILADDGIIFNAEVMPENSHFNYANICSKPASKNWSGNIIGKDRNGHSICKTNNSRYVKSYTVGITIDKTAIVLRNGDYPSEELLDPVAKDIFGSMEKASD